jgi:hypothetical protein
MIRVDGLYYRPCADSLDIYCRISDRRILRDANTPMEPQQGQPKEGIHSNYFYCTPDGSVQWHSSSVRPLPLSLSPDIPAPEGGYVHPASPDPTDPNDPHRRIMQYLASQPNTISSSVALSNSGPSQPFWIGVPAPRGPAVIYPQQGMGQTHYGTVSVLNPYSLNGFPPGIVSANSYLPQPHTENSFLPTSQPHIAPHTNLQSRKAPSYKRSSPISRKQPQNPPPFRAICIYQLSSAVTPEDVEQFFGSSPDLEEVVLKSSRIRGSKKADKRRTATAYFTNADQAYKAWSRKCDHLIRGKEVKLELARDERALPHDERTPRDSRTHCPADPISSEQQEEDSAASKGGVHNEGNDDEAGELDLNRRVSADGNGDSDTSGSDRDTSTPNLRTLKRNSTGGSQHSLP